MQPNLSISDLKDLTVPCPPKFVQNRIVAILNKVFANISRSKEIAEQNLANAREMFESYLQNVFANPGDGSEERELRDFCEIKHGFAFDGRDFGTDFTRLMPVLLTPGNFHETCHLLFTDKNTKRYKGKVSNDWLLGKGDLVIVMTDLSSQMKILGKPAFVEQENLLHNQRIGRFIFKTDNICKRFIYYYLQTKDYLLRIKRTATGTMVRHTAPKRILDNRLFLPNHKNQLRIVAKLDTLSAETKKLETIYRQKLASLEELKKSILQKAFSGAL
jgi:type I restriction enzyme S subunit